MKRTTLVDYCIVDEKTNCTFIVDVEGQKYLLPPEAPIPAIGTPVITVSGLVVTISGIDIFNEVTVESPDVYVTVSGLSENLVYEEIYIQGYNSSNFPNNNSFHYIPFTQYTALAGEVLHITSLTAAQTKSGYSTIAFYRNNVREREIPMIEDLHITFPKEHRYYEGETVSIGFKPYDKKTRIQVFADGYITEE